MPRSILIVMAIGSVFGICFVVALAITFLFPAFGLLGLIWIVGSGIIVLANAFIIVRSMQRKNKSTEE
jgi:hypothetical protein